MRTQPNSRQRGRLTNICSVPVSDADVDTLAEQLARIFYRQIIESESATQLKQRGSSDTR